MRSSPSTIPTEAGGLHLWSRHFGDEDHQSGTDVAFAASGSVMLVGQFEGEIDLGGGARQSAGNSDIFVAELSPGGSYRWDRTYRGSANDYAGGVGIDTSAAILVAGSFTGPLQLTPACLWRAPAPSTLSS